MPMKIVEPYTLKAWLDSGEAVLVDVREPQEYQSANITGAHLVPLASVCNPALPNCDGKKLVMHCKAGGRSKSACEKLLAENPALDIYNLDGGITAWEAAGLPVNTGSAPVSFCKAKR